MTRRLMTAIAVFALALGPMAGPAPAFQCPVLIKQGREALAKAQALLDEAQKLHDGGQHAESVKKANEALVLLGVRKAQAESPRKGYGY